METHNGRPGKGEAHSPAEASPAEVHSSPVVRAVLIAVGFAALGLGILGAFLPLLPTTVFVLIAAYCFARSSERFYTALLESRHFGPLVRDWQAHRCIARRSKVYAISLIVLTFSITVGLFVSSGFVRAALVVLGASLILYLYRLPTCQTDV